MVFPVFFIITAYFDLTINYIVIKIIFLYILLINLFILSNLNIQK